MNSQTQTAQPMRGFNARAIWARQSDHMRCAALIVALIVLWVIAAQIMSVIYPDIAAQSANSGSAPAQYLGHAVRNGSMFLYVCALVYLAKLLRDSKDTGLAEHIKGTWGADRYSVPKLLGNTALGLITFGLFIFSYSTIKTRIPEMIPYRWDEAFMNWDRALFLGNDPWVVFAWMYDSPALIYAMDFIYDIWAVLLVGVWTLCFILTKPAAAIRFRFPLALLLTWFIGGNIAATLMSSAGPCYYGAITGLADPYAGQMAILAELSAQSELRATAYQGILWQVYESPSLGLGGISAMPSMHCATSFLFVLLTWKNKILRYAALSFFTFILIASVVLAWHYLVDGLVAMPIALFSWWAAGKITRRIETRIPA